MAPATTILGQKILHITADISNTYGNEVYMPGLMYIYLNGDTSDTWSKHIYLLYLASAGYVLYR